MNTLKARQINYHLYSYSIVLDNMLECKDTTINTDHIKTILKRMAYLIDVIEKNNFIPAISSDEILNYLLQFQEKTFNLI